MYVYESVFWLTEKADSPPMLKLIARIGVPAGPGQGGRRGAPGENPGQH